MVTVELHGGHSIEMDPTCLDDMELLDMIADISDDENPKPYIAGRIIEKMLGKEKKKTFYGFYRNADGRVPTADINQALLEMMTGLNAKK